MQAVICMANGKPNPSLSVGHTNVNISSVILNIHSNFRPDT
jgi:hypothetical protein